MKKKTKNYIVILPILVVLSIISACNRHGKNMKLLFNTTNENKSKTNIKNHEVIKYANCLLDIMLDDKKSSCLLNGYLKNRKKIIPKGIKNIIFQELLPNMCLYDNEEIKNKNILKYLVYDIISKKKNICYIDLKKIDSFKLSSDWELCYFNHKIILQKNNFDTRYKYFDIYNLKTKKFDKKLSFNFY